MLWSILYSTDFGVIFFAALDDSNVESHTVGFLDVSSSCERKSNMAASIYIQDQVSLWK